MSYDVRKGYIRIESRMPTVRLALDDEIVYSAFWLKMDMDKPWK